jgi:hypothetical protein
MLGQIRIIESCFPKFLSPSQKFLLENTTRVIFSDSSVQGFVPSSVALVVGDWRFRVSFPENLRKVNLIFNDFTLSNSAYAVFVNGELYGTTSGCDSRYEIRIDNPCCDYEISFRSPAHACSKCGDDLSLMLIEIVLENM